MLPCSRSPWSYGLCRRAQLEVAHARRVGPAAPESPAPGFGLVDLAAAVILGVHATLADLGTPTG
jgi:hypothetical protein